MSIRRRTAILLAVVMLAALLLVLLQRGASEKGLKAAFDAEFLTRPDGYMGLSELYGFEFSRDPMQMDPGLMYKAVADGAVDVIDGFATDGRIAAYDLLVLQDDKGFFPPYYAAPLVRAEILKKNPEIESVLNRLAGRISNDEMRDLNYRVDEKGEMAAKLAREFLVQEGLIDENGEPRTRSGQSIRIGGKQFTEQEVLGEIMASLIEYNTDLQVVRKLNLGGTMICFTALKAGDLDLYPEYTGTGLVNILKEEVLKDPQEVFEKVRREFMEQYSLVWLEPLGFNNTYTLTMRKKQARELGIRTISDLAKHLRRK